MQKEAFEDILDQEFEQMPAYGDILGRLKIAILRDRLQNGNHYVEERLRKSATWFIKPEQLQTL